MSRKRWRNRTIADLAAMKREAILSGSTAREAAISRELEHRAAEAKDRPAPPVLPPRKKPRRIPKRLGQPTPKRPDAPLHKLTRSQLVLARDDKRRVDKVPVLAEIRRREGKR